MTNVRIMNLTSSIPSGSEYLPFDSTVPGTRKATIRTVVSQALATSDTFTLGTGLGPINITGTATNVSGVLNQDPAQINIFDDFTNSGFEWLIQTGSIGKIPQLLYTGEVQGFPSVGVALLDCPGPVAAGSLTSLFRFHTGVEFGPGAPIVQEYRFKYFPPTVTGASTMFLGLLTPNGQNGVVLSGSGTPVGMTWSLMTATTGVFVTESFSPQMPVASYYVVRLTANVSGTTVEVSPGDTNVFQTLLVGSRPLVTGTFVPYMANEIRATSGSSTLAVDYSWTKARRQNTGSIDYGQSSFPWPDIQALGTVVTGSIPATVFKFSGLFTGAAGAVTLYGADVGTNINESKNSCSYPITQKLTFKNLYVNPTGNTLAGITTFKLYKNGVGTTVFLNVNAGSTIVTSDTANFVNFNTGDKLDLVITETGVGSMNFSACVEGYIT